MEVKKMIERIYALMERLVSAAELLAKAVAEAGEPSLRAKIMPLTSTGEEPKKEPAMDALGAGINYEDIVARGAAGRNALLQMCHERDIEVPPRTRTDTLVKNLKAWDLANPGLTDPGQGMNDDERLYAEDAANHPSPKKPGQGIHDDSDPFGDDPPTEDPSYTIDQVRAALQRLMVKEGKPAVVDLLRNRGGVEKLKDLPEDKFSAVMEIINIKEGITNG